MSHFTRKLAAIMFTDIVGFTDLAASDEAGAMKLLQWQRNAFQPLTAEHGGEWLKEVGDGLLLSFTSSQDAVRCAIRIQDAAGEMPSLKVRIGIHQGDIIQDGEDIMGDGVNVASRIEAAAPDGGIAFSDKVRQDISGYPEFEIVSLGEYSLKGVSHQVALFCLAPYGLPKIPEYKLLRRTGAGAYGEVWLAQTLTGMHRAVKIVRRNQFEDIRPYEREFKGITEYEPVSRKSDGLIDLLHVGRSEDDDFFYYVMELADSQRPSAEINIASYHPKTLQSELEARGRLSLEECLKHGSHLARALAFLHSQNLVHRDIKPANIVFVNGQPKLADIGLVTTMDNASTLVGTMGYIPPEGPGKPSSDIYALGMVLYELGTGKDRADFPEIDILDPALKGLNQVFLKACSNDLSERFSDASALANQLDQLAMEPIGGASAPAATGGSYKVAALAASLILALVFLSRDPPPDMAQHNPPPQSPQKQELSKPKENSNLYDLEKPKGELELHEQLTIKSGANQRWGIGMDEKGERLAVATGWAIKIWNLADGKEIFNYPTKQFTSMAYSPKGKWVAHSHGKVIDLIDPKTGTISSSLSVEGENQLYLDFHPSGTKWAAAARNNGKVYWGGLNGPKQKEELEAYGVGGLKYSPDGRWLAGWGAGLVAVWDMETKEKHAEFTHDYYTHAIAWSSDSKLIAGARGKAAGVAGDVYIWNVAEKRRVSVLKGHQNTVSAAAFSPDGKMLASSGEGDGGAQDTSIRIWDLASGRELLKNEAHKSNVFHLAYTQDGKGLVSTSMDGTTKIWKIIPKGK